MSNSTHPPSHEQAVAAARSFAAKLPASAAEAQKARRVPDAVIAQFIEAGLHRIMQPRRHGGWALGLDTHAAAAFELGKGDAAQGWVLTGYGDNAHVVAAFSEKAQDEVWGADSKALIAGTLTPNGTAATQGDNLVVSGRWTAVPGIDQAGWLLGASTVGEGEHSRKVAFLVRKSEARVVDDSKTVGVEGAGTKSFSLEHVTVPAHRVLEQSPVLSRRSSLALAAVPVGAAAAMLDTFAALVADPAKRGRRVADNFPTALRMAESKADIDAGVLSVFAAAADTMAMVSRGEPLTPERRALNSLKAGYAAMVAARAAERIFIAAGAKAILAGNPIQRFLLDINSLAALEVFAWDSTASEYGNLRLGATLA